MKEEIHHTLTIPPEMAGERLDRVLGELLSDYSRSRLQQWIKAGQVLVNQRSCLPRERVAGGEWVELRASLESLSEAEPEPMPLAVHYQDDSLLVINKPAGLVVHPAAGHHSGTLVNGLLAYDPQLGALPRAGIVHRLDKETSGLMVVARTLSAHHSLVEQLQARSVRREYLAVVEGRPVAGGRIEQPINRHPVDRLRMAVRRDGKEAITDYRVARHFRAHSELQVRLSTGRTHQIRVHMAHIRYPLIGDPLYGRRLQLPAGISTELAEQLRGFRRQALHARRLALIHPERDEEICWEAAPPEDLSQLLAALESDSVSSNR